MTFDDVTLYPNPYIVVTKKGYTKHYYAGSERLATVIGTGGLDEMAIPFERLRHEKVNKIEDEIEDAFREGYKGHNPFRQLLSRQVETTDIGGNKKCELDYNCKPAILETLEIYVPKFLFIDQKKISHYEKIINHYICSPMPSAMGFNSSS